MRPRSKRRWIALVAVLATILAACGDGEEGGEGTTGEGADARTVIRFAFAPDPVWDYMNDNGHLVEWEEENNIRIVTSTTWDEFTFFAGGHGDIVSMGTLEIPVLEQETEIETVTFGKYNALRDSMMTLPGSGYETIADIPPGSTLCVASPVSATGFWAVAANELHDGIDFRVGGGDFELIVNDHFVNPQNMVDNEDCEAGIFIPEAATPYMRTDDMVVMYEGQSPFQLYNTFSGFESEEAHIMSNLFTATEAFYDANEEAAAAFLALWQQGLGLWEENQADIISTYPQHFAVESDEDIAFITEYMAGPNDWFVDSVYMTDEWVEAEQAIWDLQTALNPDNANYLEAGFDPPRFEVIPAP